MNRFNKIMLLGLLSIVTGATSVKGMSAELNTLYGKLETKDYSGIPDNADFPVKEKFDVLDADDKAKIATLRAYLAIKNVQKFPMTEDGKVDVNGSAIQLNEQQIKLVNDYLEVFVISNVSLLGKSEAGASTSAAATKTVVTSGMSRGKKIAIAAAAIALAASAYVGLGNMYYDKNCEAGSANGLCMATAPANAASAATLQFLVAAGTAIATGATIACEAVGTGVKTAYNIYKNPITTYVNKELVTLEVAPQSVVEASTAGYFDGLLWFLSRK